MHRPRVSAKQLGQRVLYFAYGSNMHQPRLESRVGPVKCLGTYELPGYKLTFDTGNDFQNFANVKAQEGETCEGVIYEMSYKQLLQLDWYEGLYERVKETYNDRKLHVYVSNKWRNDKSQPGITWDYRVVLMKGCATHNLQKSLQIVKGVGNSYDFMGWLERWD